MAEHVRKRRYLHAHVPEVEPTGDALRQIEVLLVLNAADENALLEGGKVDRGLRAGAAVVDPGKVCPRLAVA